uniref:Uncharacterized protein n=1 Tax=Eptatretus burgeri TaxID=7764 RepID=A0A8C4QCU0_EPTBU
MAVCGLEFIETMVLQVVQTKADEWAKVVASEDNRRCVKHLQEADHVVVLVVAFHTAGTLALSLGFCSKVKGKSVYFEKNDERGVLFGELMESPVEEFGIFLEEILFDLLSNKENHKDWPEVSSDDIVKHARRLKRDVAVVNGLIQGKTLLTLPITSVKTDDLLKETKITLVLAQRFR